MTIIGSLRDAVTAAGGSPSAFDKITLLRQLITSYGGTPTQRSVIGLLREAVTAAGGTPTQWSEVMLLRELLAALGVTAITFLLYKLYEQLAAAGGGATSLKMLGLSANSIAENSSAGTVVGSLTNTTSGSTLSITDTAGTRFALSGSNIVAGATPTDYEAATSYNITIREVKSGFVNTPRDTVLTINVTNVFEAASLGALSLSSTSYTEGSATSGTINGATSGSTIAISGAPPGFTINSGARTWAYDGSSPPATTSITLTETLADSANSPRATSISITVAAAYVLGTLALSGTLTNGTASSGTITGATAGSTITSNVTGLTVNSGARTYSFDGTAAAGTTANGLVETLTGATGSPKDNSVTVASGAALAAPVLTKTSATGDNPIRWSSDYTGTGAAVGDTLRLRWRVDSGAWQYDTDRVVTSDDFFDMYDGTAAFDWALYLAAAPFPTGKLVEVQEGFLPMAGGGPYYSTTLSDTMVATATITVAAANAGRFQSNDLAAEGYPVTLVKTLAFSAGTLGIEVHAYEAVTSVKINGVTVSTPLVAGVAPNAFACSIWTASTASAGNYVVEITFANAIGSVFVQAFAGSNLGSVADTKNVTETPTAPIAPATNLTIPANGVGLAVVYGSLASSVSWARAVQIYSGSFVAAGDLHQNYGATVATTGKPTATQSGGNVAMLCVSWNKV